MYACVCCVMHAAGLPTVPSTIAEERATNPFMRVHEAAVQAYTQRQDAVEAMAEVRRLKTGVSPELHDTIAP